MHRHVILSLRRTVLLGAARPEHTYIILLTVRQGRQSYLNAIEVGADDLLVKPLDEEMLPARLHVAERVLHLLPICAVCKKIKLTEDRWQQIEAYVSDRSDARFSRGLCPDCYAKAIEEVP